MGSPQWKQSATCDRFHTFHRRIGPVRGDPYRPHATAERKEGEEDDQPYHGFTVPRAGGGGRSVHVGFQAPLRGDEAGFFGDGTLLAFHLLQHELHWA